MGTKSKIDAGVLMSRCREVFDALWMIHPEDRRHSWKIDALAVLGDIGSAIEAGQQPSRKQVRKLEIVCAKLVKWFPRLRFSGTITARGRKADRTRKASRRGTVKPSYAAYLASNEWALRRRKAIAAHPACTNCNAVDNLQAHHLSYARLGSELTGDLMVLCAICHGRVHDWLDENFPGLTMEAKVRRTKDALRAFSRKHLPAANTH